MTEPLLELRRVAFGYPERLVLRDLDLRLEVGERLALIGANGSGKTTLLHLLVGLKRPTAGAVVAFGDVRETEAAFLPVRRRVGLLFQDADDQLFCPTVIEDVAFGPLNLGLSPAQARAVAEETLAMLGLDGYAGRITHRLSGGEKRLVSLATVLAMHPEVLLLDEPTSGLDEATEQRLIDHLADLPQTMLFVTHDQDLVTRLATRILRLKEGRLHEIANPSRMPIKGLHLVGRGHPCPELRRPVTTAQIRDERDTGEGAGPRAASVASGG
ncbi:ABC transporter ATP-binding protein [Thioalkalicoccus limnaeus]|uniref:ABC transporter ATP-binding protein n=1 Tax=Thioalkalicoccus limnaeus TaxID=120681 RepID=A0ABV4B9L8_9GAMM